jgi:tRNA pseudouridine38-40 synthase
MESDARVTRRLLLWLAYDGGPWQGWQGQPNGLGIQNQLERAFAAVAGVVVGTEGAGRTDSGVHALGQLAHADVPAALGPTPGQWMRALNDRLPGSIRVLRAEWAPEGFHARFSAEGKIYRYLIARAVVLDPFRHGRVWHLPGTDLEVELLQAALVQMVGRHDFRRLSSKRADVTVLRTDAEATTREVTAAGVTEQGDELRVEVVGEGFLYRMVRVMVGTAVQVARGRLPLAAAQEFLARPDGLRSTLCAPPEGLYLAEVLSSAVSCTSTLRPSDST